MATPAKPEIYARLHDAARRGIEVPISTLSLDTLRVSQQPEHLLSAELIREVLLADAQNFDPRGIRISGARITGKLDLRHAHPDTGLALIGCAFDQEVDLTDAHLPWLTLTGSHLPRLAANRLEVDGEVKLDTGFTVETDEDQAVLLVAARIHGQLDLSGARLVSKSSSALVADRAQIDGSLCLKRQFYARGGGDQGTLRLAESHIGGQLVLTEAEIVNNSGPALVGEQATIDGAVFMSEPLKATGHGKDGTIRLRSAELSNVLMLNGARLTNDAGPAFSADGLRISADLSMADVQLSGRGDRGAIRLTGARIDGQLDASGAQITNSTGPALWARDLHVGESFYFGEGFTAQGEGKDGAVHLAGASVCAQIIGTCSRITNRSGPSISAGRLHAHNDIDLGTDVPLTGALVLSGAAVDGKLNLAGLRMLECRGKVLDLGGVKTRELTLSPTTVCTDTRSHTASTTEVGVAGLTYTFFPDVDSERWLHLLRHHTPKYSPQPYQQLAVLLKSYGHDNDARTVLRAQQDDLRSRGDLGGWVARSAHWAWGQFAGYGYRIRRIAAALAVALFLAAGLGVIAGSVPAGDGGRPAAAPTSPTVPPGTTCSFVERIGLGLDRGLPLASTGIRNRCDLDTYSFTGQVFTAALWLIQLIVWALATLAIAGYTGLIRRLS